ncbi:cytochrome P450 [Favolaschia claudopus]|uniref:Cytochrome P450 n=1 Tax=Favolaschia claudopus TaxID=2862362 RepID=A0AAW0DH76_9AGAR
MTSINHLQSAVVPAAVTILGILLGNLLFSLARILHRNWTSGLHYIDGPKSSGFFLGNFKELNVDYNASVKWRQQFGRIFKFKSFFSNTELHVGDVKAISYILSRPDKFERTPIIRNSMETLLGRGIISAEGDDHKRHRRALNPAFSAGQIRAMTGIFVEKGEQLREFWTRELTKNNGTAQIEVQSWLRRLTLDVIGQAGFDYSFDALESEGKDNPLNDAFTDVFHSTEASRYAAFRLAGGIMPILKLLPGPGWSVVRAARRTMFSISGQIVDKSRANIAASEEGNRSLDGKRDLLSSLLKANMGDTKGQRLSDDELISQIPAFFLAGHETTSSALSWSLHALSQNIRVQDKLRAELSSLVPTDNPTMDDLNSLPYLELVVREVMRVHSPVMFFDRMPVEDEVLPLSEPYVGRDGEAREFIPIRKGQYLHIPVIGVNTDRKIWGEDADEFKPERWEHMPPSATGIPNVWGNSLTFSSGNHHCIGFRFSVVETKAILFILLRAFKFESALPNSSIVPATMAGLVKPSVLGKGPHSGLPLIVKVCADA